MGMLISTLIAEGLRQVQGQDGKDTSVAKAVPETGSKADQSEASPTVTLLRSLPKFSQQAVKGASRFFSQVAKLPQDLKAYSQKQISQTESRVDQLLSQVGELAKSQDLTQAGKALIIAQGQIDLLAQVHAKGENNPKVKILRAQWKIASAQILEAQGDSAEATERYQKAIVDLDDADQNTLVVSPLKTKILGLKADAKHQLRDYQGARMDRFWAAQGMDMKAKTAQRVYDHELSQLADDLEFQAFYAQETGHRKQEAAFVAEAVLVNEALGREEVASGLETYLKELTQEVMPQVIQDQAKEQANLGTLSPRDLQYFPQLSKFVTLTPSQGQGFVLEFTPDFSGLAGKEQAQVLEQLQQAGVAGRIRDKAEGSENPVERLFYQSKLDMMDGRVEAAKVHLRQLRRMAQKSQDPMEQALKSEAENQLRAFTLAHLEQLQARNEVLESQRGSHLFKKPAYEIHADMNISLVKKLRSYVEAGDAVTVEDALQQLVGEASSQRQKLELPQIPYYNWSNPQLPPLSKLEYYYHSMDLMDPQFKLLLDLETGAQLEKRMTPEARNETLLEAAQGLRARDGSYEISGEIFSGLFDEELQQARSQISQDKITRIRNDSLNGFTQYKIKEGIEERLEALKEQDPLQFKNRYPQGWPNRDQMSQLVSEATEARIAMGTNGEAYKILDARFQSQGFDNPTAAAAWTDFKDMKDPTGEFWNFSDATWDAVLDEVVITAVTLPVTMGAGAALRGAIASSRWATRTASASRIGRMAVRGTTFTSGVLVEGAVQELQMGLYTGEAHMKNLGFNLVMSTAFHGGGKIWGRYAQEIGVDATAQQLARAEGRVWAARGKSALDFSGMLGTQTLLGTFMADPANQGDIRETFAASFLRQLGGHGATGTLRAFMPRTMAWEAEGMAKQDHAQVIRDQALDLGFHPERAQAMAESVLHSQETSPLAQAVDSLLRQPAKATPLGDVKSYGFKQFSEDTLGGLHSLWQSAEQFVVGPLGSVQGPKLALAHAGAGVSTPAGRGKVTSTQEGFGLLHMFRTAEMGSAGGGEAKTQVRVHEDIAVGTKDYLDLSQAQKLAYQKVVPVEELLFDIQNQLGPENLKLDVKFLSHPNVEGKNYSGKKLGDLIEMHMAISPNIVRPKRSGHYQTLRHIEGMSESSLTLIREMNNHHSGEVGLYNLAELLPHLGPKAKTTMERLITREENYRDHLNETVQGLYADLANNFRGQDGDRSAKVSQARYKLMEAVRELEMNPKGLDWAKEYELIELLTPEQRKTYHEIAGPLRNGHHALEKTTVMTEEQLFTALRELEGLPPLPNRVQLSLDDATMQIMQYLEKASKNKGKLELSFSSAERPESGEGMILYYRLQGETRVTDPNSRHGRSITVEVDDVIAIHLAMTHVQAAVFQLADLK